MKQEKIRVALADDIELVCRTMAAVLSRDAAIEVVGTAPNGEQLIKLCERERPNVAVIDIQMPVMDGIEATKWLRKHMPEIKILTLTTFDDEEYIQELLSIGIDGYILKSGGDEPFINAVKSVYMGVSTLAPAVLTKLASLVAANTSKKLEPSAAPPPDGTQESDAMDFTPMELRVAELIAKDYYNKDIAFELGITYGRVRNIVSTIYRKLGVTERDLIREYLSEYGEGH